MKAFFLSLVILLFISNAATALAASTPAAQSSSSADSRFLTFSERTLICEAIEKYNEASGTEFALDRPHCQNVAPMQANFLSQATGSETYIVNGTFNFSAPDVASYQANCSVLFVKSDRSENLVGDAAIHVNCQ